MTEPLEIRGSGDAVAIYQGEARISRFFTRRDNAIAALPGIERRRQHHHPRPCLTCNEIFDSAGVHNRMCRTCRQATA